VSIGGGGVVSGRGAKRGGYPVNLIDNLFISSNIGETDSPVVQGQAQGNDIHYRIFFKVSFSCVLARRKNARFC